MIDILTENDAANFLGMSVHWLRKGRADAFGPTYVKLGRSVRYMRADLETYIQNNRSVPNETNAQ